MALGGTMTSRARMSNTPTAPRPAPAAPIPTTPDPATPAVTSMSSTTLLTPATVAERLGVSLKTLQNWRGRGDGPKFVSLSRKVIRYSEPEVDAFLARRTMESTAGM